MNTIKKINLIILAVVGLLTINSCVKDDEFALPPVVCNDTWETNLSIVELFAMVDAAPETILSFDDEQVIEGYVVSSDSTGNFFKTVSIQDHPTTPTRALQVEMDRTNLFNNFPLGSKIKVNLSGLNVGYDRGTLKVGTTYVDGGGATRVGRMDEYLIDAHVARSCDPSENITPVVYNSINEAITGAEANGRINTLITINNVQFVSTGITYADAVNQTTLDRPLQGATQETSSQTVVLRTSGYADFADQVVPEGSGSITAVLSKYNSTWQLFIRDTNDVQFNNPRFGDGGGNGAGPIGGGDAEYSVCLSEDFEGFAVNETEFDGYINDAAAGTRYWEVRSFSNNNYIQMSSHNSTDASNEVYFIVPVNFSEADSFSFKTKDGYNNGNVLQVYYTTNYTLGQGASESSLTEITSSFTISSGNADGYGANFIESGSYSLASLSGNGAIVFKYDGTTSATTTMQIDDIQVIDNETPDCGGGSGGGDNLFEDGFNNLNNWTTHSIVGAQVWETRNFGNPAPCAYMSGFASGAQNNEDWLVSNAIAIPAGMSSATVSFETDRGYDGNALEVFYTTNFTGDVTTTTWTSLPAVLDTQNDWNTWTNSGDLDVSAAIGGNLYIAFKYTSTTSAAATWELDNVVVAAE